MIADIKAHMMFDQANSFYICAKLCEDKLENGVSRFDMYSTPQIVNLALACEIYLKTLLFCIDDKTPVKAHRLDDLVKMLPADIKDSLMQSVSERFPTMNNVWGFSYLELVSKAFTDWRYSYEQDRLSCEVGYLMALADALKEECSQLIYEISWNEYYKSNKLNSDL